MICNLVQGHSHMAHITYDYCSTEQAGITYHNEDCIKPVALQSLPPAVVCVALALYKLHPMHIPLLSSQE